MKLLAIMMSTLLIYSLACVQTALMDYRHMPQEIIRKQLGYLSH